jgi:hypothetical protein
MPTCGTGTELSRTSGLALPERPEMNVAGALNVGLHADGLMLLTLGPDALTNPEASILVDTALRNFRSADKVIVDLSQVKPGDFGPLQAGLVALNSRQPCGSLVLISPPSSPWQGALTDPAPWHPEPPPVFAGNLQAALQSLDLDGLPPPRERAEIFAAMFAARVEIRAERALAALRAEHVLGDIELGGAPDDTAEWAPPRTVPEPNVAGVMRLALHDDGLVVLALAPGAARGDESAERVGLALKLLHTPERLIIDLSELRHDGGVDPLLGKLLAHARSDAGKKTVLLIPRDHFLIETLDCKSLLWAEGPLAVAFTMEQALRGVGLDALPRFRSRTAVYATGLDGQVCRAYEEASEALSARSERATDDFGFKEQRPDGRVVISITGTCMVNELSASYRAFRARLDALANEAPPPSISITFDNPRFHAHRCFIGALLTVGTKLHRGAAPLAIDRCPPSLREQLRITNTGQFFQLVGQAQPEPAPMYEVVVASGQREGPTA